MAIANSAAESPKMKKRDASHLEKPVEEEVEKKNEMVVDDQQVGKSGSGDSKQSGAPIAGNQVEDSNKWHTCHQCRQKTLDYVAECKNIKKNKQCVIKVCYKCLFNRYREKAKEVNLLDDWKCPKCRGICNCSNCMRKRGQKPTGKIPSALEMTTVKGTEILTKPVSPEKSPASDETCDMSLEPMQVDDTEKDEEPKEVEIILPHGTELTNVAELDLPAEDVGNGLQFMEFCCTFGEILNIKKGQAESILYDIMTGRSRPGKTTALIQFQIQLLTLMKDLGEESSLTPLEGKNCWLHVLKECISESEWVPKELAALDFDTIDEYCAMGSSEKLRLLVFLCDETLQTMPFRTWIEEQNLKFFEEKREARSRLLAAKEKAKLLKKQLHDEAVKATSAKDDDSISGQALVSEVKEESERAHKEILETRALLPRYERKSDALRTEPVFMDAKGHVFWSLKGCNKSDLVLQDVSYADEEKSSEKWFSFDHEEIKVINEHISLHRVKRQRRRKAPAPAAAALTPAPAPAPEATNMENRNSSPKIDLNEIPDPTLCNADEAEL